MNHYRKPTDAEMETARQSRIRRENLPPDLQIEEKLADLQTFVTQLANTPHGKADLERRARIFGACLPAEGESRRHYYGKLRDWLDRECEAPRGCAISAVFS